MFMGRRRHLIPAELLLFPIKSHRSRFKYGAQEEEEVLTPLMEGEMLLVEAEVVTLYQIVLSLLQEQSHLLLGLVE
jgi:hypothetical protein